MEWYLVVPLAAGLVSMDTTSGPQVLVSEPIVSCTLLGLLFGRPDLGIMAGILFQMLWIGYLPLGGEHFTDNNMAAFISCSSFLAAQRLFGPDTAGERASLIVMLVYGVVVGIIGLHLRNYERRLNGVRADALINSLDCGDPAPVGRAHMAGIVTSFGKGVLMATVLVPVGIMLCRLTVMLPPPLVRGMANASLIVWGAVAASGIMFYLAKGRAGAIVFGSLGGIAWIVLANL